VYKFFAFFFLITLYRTGFAQQELSYDTTMTGKGRIPSITYSTHHVRDSICYFTVDGSKTSTFIPIGSGSKGQWIFYRRNGHKYSEYYVDRNLRQGLCIIYHSNGTVAARELYKNNLLEGVVTTYYQTGAIHSKVKYSGGKLEGESVFFYPDGKVQWKGGYKKGHMRGERLYYDEKGYFINGIFTIHSESGALEREGFCVNGKPQGEIKIYGRPDKITLRSNFADGKADGPTLYYDTLGNLRLTEIYKAGKFVKEIPAAKK
jgi:antitoxin component YwqK of YwqJK toxin-antitoxin module